MYTPAMKTKPNIDKRHRTITVGSGKSLQPRALGQTSWNLEHPSFISVLLLPLKKGLKLVIPALGEPEAGESCVRGQPQLYSELKPRLGYMRHCLIKQEKTTKNKGLSLKDRPALVVAITVGVDSLQARGSLQTRETMQEALQKSICNVSHDTQMGNLSLHLAAFFHIAQSWARA